MKKCLLIALLAISTQAMAENFTCEDIGSIAGKIMEARQLNIPMTKILEPINGDKLLTTIIIDAYETTAFRAESNRADAMARFRNKWELACIKSKQ